MLFGWTPSEDTLRLFEVGSQVGGLALIAGAAIGFVFDRVRETGVRRSELAWRKTEFLWKLARDFDATEAYRRVAQAVEPPGTDLNAVCTLPYGDLTEEQKALALALDQFLDFFDWLYGFVFTTKVLTLDEVVPFSGHIDFRKQPLRGYAFDRGFSGPIILDEAFTAHLKKWKPDRQLKRLVPNAEEIYRHAAADASLAGQPPP